MDVRLTYVESPSSTPLDLLVSASDDALVSDLPAPLRPSVQSQEASVRDTVYDGMTVGHRPAAAPPEAGPLVLVVSEGPDAGHLHPLPRRGQVAIGRSGKNDVCLSDPSVSRVHATLHVDPTGVRIVRASDVNTVTVAGDPDASFVRVGQQIRCGASALSLRVAAHVPASSARRGTTWAVNRAPRARRMLSPVEATWPELGGPFEGQRLPLITMLLPLMLSVPMAFLMQMPMMLLFGLMSPIMMVGQWLVERKNGKSKAKRTRRQVRQERQEVRAVVESAVAHELALRTEATPDLATCLMTCGVAQQAGRPGHRLWERRRSDVNHSWPEHPTPRPDDEGAQPSHTPALAPAAGPMALLVGHGSVKSHVRVKRGTARTAARALPLSDAPVTIDVWGQAVAVCGDRDLRTAMARSLLLQMLTLHSPWDVHVAAICTDRTRATWQDLPWAPHAHLGIGGDLCVVDGEEQIGQLIKRLRAHHQKHASTTMPRPAPWPRVVVILDCPDVVARHSDLAAMVDDPGPAMAIVALSAARSDAPQACQTVVEVTSPVEARVETAKDPAGPCRPSLLSAPLFSRACRALAPLRDAAPREGGAAVPRAARLLDVLDWDATDAALIEQRWAAAPRTTEAIVGVDGSGPYALDLAADGPHGLVGGTTGSGKSEFLQTLITALALGNRPDEMVFVLVDYKGGAAFKDCARLPHTVGLVTDLDGHLTRRALISLGAELTRREHMLAAVGAKDLDDYVAGYGDGRPVMPRLVLVIDEFKMLAEELPDFMTGLVKIAAVGRSLGVHLVLATQRPGGIVSADIRANVNLRVALRVRDVADSRDVVDSPDAADIPASSPGRAILRTGGSTLDTVQSARVGGHGPKGGRQVTVRPLDPDAALPAALTATDTAPDDGDSAIPDETDLARLVGSLNDAATRVAVERQPSPWLPPLPAQVCVDDLPPTEDDAAAVTQIPFGLADDPERQAQPTAVWDLTESGHLGVSGRARSGRTTLVRTLLLGLCRQLAPDEAWVYVIEDSRHHRVLENLPHVGAVASVEEGQRVGRILDRLAALVDQRRRLLADAGLTSVADQWSQCSPSERLPYVVLAIDGWSAFLELHQQIEHGRHVDVLRGILREGLAAGVLLLITGERDLVSGRWGAQLPTRYALPMNDPMDLTSCGIARTKVPEHQPTGRVLNCGNSQEIQVATVGDGTSAAIADAVRSCCEQWESRAAAPSDRLAPPVMPLPSSTPLPTPGEASGPWAPTARGKRGAMYTVGVAGDDLHPVGWGRDQLAALICGPPGSGRTTMLRALASQVLAEGRAITWWSSEPPPDVPDDGLPFTFEPLDETATSEQVYARSEGDDLLSVLKARRHAVLFYDDVDRVLGTPSDDALVDWVRAARHGDCSPLVAAGATSGLNGRYRGIAGELTRAATGVILWPRSTNDGDALGVRTTPAEAFVPGRGTLVKDGRMTAMQGYSVTPSTSTDADFAAPTS